MSFTVKAEYVGYADPAQLELRIVERRSAEGQPRFEIQLHSFNSWGQLAYTSEYRLVEGDRKLTDLLSLSYRDVNAGIEAIHRFKTLYAIAFDNKAKLEEKVIYYDKRRSVSG